MRLNVWILLAGILLLPFSAVAGNITNTNGQFTWQSTQCQAPTPPASLSGASSYTPADEMNKKVTEYNQYVGVVQAYMDCISREAQTDASTISQAVTRSAQASIDDARKNMADLAPVKKEK